MELVTKAASLINRSASSAAGGVGARLNEGMEPKCLYKRLYTLTPAGTNKASSNQLSEGKARKVLR